MPDPQSPTVDPAQRPPEWLEPGATWTANRGGPNEYTFRLLSRAHNDGGWIAGYEQWRILGAYERIAPGQEYFAGVREGHDANITRAELNWSSVAALRSQPAPVPPTESEGPKVGETWELNHDDAARESLVLIKCLAADGYYTIKWLSGTSGLVGETIAGYGRNQLKRLSPPAPEATATPHITAALGPSTMHPFEVPDRSAWKELLPKDPYAEHNATLTSDHAVMVEMQRRDAIFCKRRADTLRDFDRPLSPPRYPNRYVCIGVMGDGAPVKRREAKGHPAMWPSCGDEDP